MVRISSEVNVWRSDIGKTFENPSLNAFTGSFAPFPRNASRTWSMYSSTFVWSTAVSLPPDYKSDS
jgi:hypothetical protein